MNSADYDRIQNTRVESHFITCMVRILKSYREQREQFSPHSRHVTVIMHDIKVADGTVTLRKQQTVIQDILNVKQCLQHCITIVQFEYSSLSIVENLVKVNLQYKECFFQSKLFVEVSQRFRVLFPVTKYMQPEWRVTLLLKPSVVLTLSHIESCIKQLFHQSTTLPCQVTQMSQHYYYQQKRENSRLNHYLSTKCAKYQCFTLFVFVFLQNASLGERVDTQNL